MKSMGANGFLASPLHILLRFRATQSFDYASLRVGRKQLRYTVRRGDVLHFRRRVPKGKEAAFGGKREFVRTLRAGSAREAELAWAAAMTEFNRIARGEPAVSAVPAYPAILDGNFADRLARAFVRESLEINLPVQARIGTGVAVGDDDDEAPMSPETFASSMHGAFREARKALLTKAYPSSWRLAATSMLLNAGIDPKAHPGSLEAATRAYGEARAEIAMRIANEARGKPGRVSNVAMFGPEAYAQDERGPAQTLEAASERFLSNPDRQFGSSSMKQYAPRLKVLIEALGKDRPITEITLADCRRCVESVVLRLPLKHSAKYPGLPLLEAVERGARDQAKTISGKTQQLYAELLRTFFNWAEADGLIENSPARKLKRLKVDKGSRNDFSIEQLQAIFSAPVFAGCENDLAGYSRPGTSKLRRGRFWVPIISLYSGMRINEVVGLRARDVRTVYGVRVFDVREDLAEGRRLKNKASARLVPIHPMLVELGFLKHIETVEPSGLLFPELGRAKNPSKAFGQWFGRLLDTLGISDPKLTFHSLRHTYATGCRESGISWDQWQAIGGWSTKSVADGYGRHPIGTLAAALSKLEYVGLDLSHLKQEG